MESPRRDYTIHVFPHVKKFMKKSNIPYENRTFISEEYSTFGKLVTYCLRCRREKSKAAGSGYGTNSQSRDRLTASITIRLTVDQSRMSVRLAVLQHLATELDDLFKEALLTWISAQEVLDVPALSACRHFLDYHGIDENEYSLDAAYKCWQRARAKKKEKSVENSLPTVT